MTADTPFVGDPADSREAIMRATHRALHAHGYAGLSIQRIADEAELSKSTFYHHYDGKDDLLVSFSGYMLEEFVRLFTLEAGDDPAENLRTFVDLLLDESPDIDRELPDDIDEILGTYVELRAQAVRDDEFRQQFTQTDRGFVTQVEQIIQSGVDRGVFAPVDSERVAEFVVTVIAGNSFRRTTCDDHSSEDVRAAVHEYIDECVLS